MSDKVIVNLAADLEDSERVTAGPESGEQVLDIIADNKASGASR